MPPPTEEERQSIIDAFKARNENPNQYKLGIPDSGPFMKDLLNHLSKRYQGLAPAAQQVDPFTSFPHEPRSGRGDNPYADPYTNPYGISFFDDKSV